MPNLTFRESLTEFGASAIASEKLQKTQIDYFEFRNLYLDLTEHPKTILVIDRGEKAAWVTILAIIGAVVCGSVFKGDPNPGMMFFQFVVAVSLVFQFKGWRMKRRVKSAEATLKQESERPETALRMLRDIRTYSSTRYPDDTGTAQYVDELLRVAEMEIGGVTFTS